MNYIMYLVGLCSLSCAMTSPNSSQDAAHAYNAGDMQMARQLVLEQYAGPARIYNLGLIAYSQQDYQSAGRYWQLAREEADAELARRCTTNSALVAEQLSSDGASRNQSSGWVKRFVVILQLLGMLLVGALCIMCFKSSQRMIKVASFFVALLVTFGLYQIYLIDTALQGCVMVNTGMRVGPASCYKEIGKLSQGESVGIIVQRGSWTHVSAHDQKGWIESNHLVIR